MTGNTTDAATIERLFTSAEGGFRFARWGRPLAPLICGTDDQGIRIFEAGLRSVAALAGLEVVEIDPELAANFLVVFVNDWAELTAVPALDKLIPGVGGLATRMERAGANQYRLFVFTEAGAIRICVTLIRYDAEMQRVSARTLAVTQSLLGLLLWADGAFAAESPVALVADAGPNTASCVVKPWYASVLRAAYHPSLPAASAEPALALRLAARMAVMEAAET